MTGRHRRGSKKTARFTTAKVTAAKFTAVGAATATATALTVSVPPPPDERTEIRQANVDLSAAISPWPEPGQLPDLTFGLGTLGYDTSQAVADLLIRAIVENVNLAAIAQASGVDLDSLLEGLLGGELNDLVGGVLDGVLNGIPLDTGGLVDAILGPLNLGPIIEGALADALGLVGADSVGGLLQVLGIDLGDVLNLSNLVDTVPGVNTITAGPAFTLLKLLGVDIGWLPALPNSVAGEINNTEYLPIGVNGLLETVVDLLGDLGPVGDVVAAILNPVIGTLPNLDILDLRVPITIGIGLGAFAAATGYDKVLADLANQPGGVDFEGDSPLLGSLTVLPMLLLLNPARPNGGMFSRFYPLADLLGINTVNPETEATSSCGGPLCIPVLNTGLTLGGANLLPLLIDVGLGYFPANDLAAWPNPFSLANNALALGLPTYLLRGLDLSTVDEQVTSQVGDILQGVLAGDPLAVNLYLTLMPNTLPVLEPLYLLSDVISLASFGALATNPVGGLANALAPALSALVNLGYTDVVRNEDGTYTRTLTEAGVPTPFLSFPAGINPLQVPVDVINLLVQGFQKEFFSGNPTPGTPNAITGLLDLLTGGDLLSGLPLGDLAGLVQGIVQNIVGQLNPAAVTEQTELMSATSVPTPNARTFTVSTEENTDESQSDETKPAGAEGTDEVDEDVVEDASEVDEDVVEDEVVDEDAEDEDADDEVVDEDAEDEEEESEELTDEDLTDEDDADEKDAGGDDDDADTGDGDDRGQEDGDNPGNKVTPNKAGSPKHAKPDTGGTVTSINSGSPKHAKADTNSSNDSDNGDAGSNTGSAGGASNDAA